jgi:gas vesicle protein
MGRIADVRGRHPLATGIVAGTAVGACLGLLFAPRRGSETRSHLVNSTSNGYRRAKGSVGNWTHRGRGVYTATRDRIVKGAKGTGRYVRDVADAVTMKAHRQSDAPLRRVSPSPTTSVGSPGQRPRVVERVHKLSIGHSTGRPPARASA